MDKIKVSTDEWTNWLKRYERYNAGFAYDAIIDYLREGQRGKLNPTQRHYQFLELPSFGQYNSYEIFTILHFDSVTLTFTPKFHFTKTTWDFKLNEANYKKLKHENENTVFYPQFDIKHTEFERSVFEQLISLFQINLPIWFAKSIDENDSGFDGAYYELAIGDSELGVRYQWWEYVPETWQPLIDACDKAKTLLDSLL